MHQPPHVLPRAGLQWIKGLRSASGLCTSMAVCASMMAVWATVAAATVATGPMSAAQIVERFATARGGLSAWRSVQSLTLSGTIEVGRGDLVQRGERLAHSARAGDAHAGNARTGAASTATAVVAAPATPVAQTQLPFRLRMQRPHDTRLEVDFAGKTAVQVYDGQSGWKLRPFLNRTDIEPFTAEETSAAASNADLDSPLLDYAAKGTKVSLEGVEPIAGHDAYRLKLTFQDGSARHVWIDTHSFLDVRVEGVPRRMDGKLRRVWIDQNDFRTVQGVRLPFEYVTATEASPETHRMTIGKAEINPRLDPQLFARPRA